ncbi:MAG: sigma-54-dependent Fis family transcriptional regulator [bacterium]|nr:sigma-54-dependent Fis family transcriptional regulator [bacterium]
MLGESDAFRGFRRDLERVAGSDVTVLIQGEHGCGKSIAARVLHRASARSDGPYLEVHLAGLAPSLIEAELFGHVEGAFTGASKAREGRFRAANGGTLVLDGIERLSPELQVKLLRVLQERVIEPLGSEESLPIDVRVVATSSLDLAVEVREQRFREDLYYRVAVVVLRVPPLRAREGDLPILAAALVGQAAATVGVPERPLSAAALERLAAHPWPGNVRELENALERVLVLAPSGARTAVEAAELDFLGEAVEGSEQELAREVLARGLSIDAFTHALLEVALAEERGNVSAAARRIGLSRRAFEYRLRKLGEEAGVAGNDASSSDLASSDTPSSDSEVGP